MRIAVIADIHANMSALDAVIEDLDRQVFDEILVGGDLVGRGPQGDAVCARIIERGWRSVRGNHEDYLIDFRRKRVNPEWLDAPHWSAARWMAAELSTESLQYIESLPFDLRSEHDLGFAVYHGTPESNAEGLGSWTPEEVVRERLAMAECEVLAVAHTHRPIHWRFENQLVANVGSVGLPFNGDPRSQYSIFEQIDGEWQVEVIYVEYDRDESLRQFEKSGFLLAGGSTSLLLTHEIRNARPFLVPFLRWTAFHHYEQTVENAEKFLQWYDPNTRLADLMKLLEETTLD